MDHVVVMTVVHNVWVFVNHSGLAYMCVYYNILHVNVIQALMWLLPTFVVGIMVEGWGRICPSPHMPPPQMFRYQTRDARGIELRYIN